LILSTNITTD